MSQTQTTLKSSGIKCEGCAAAARAVVEKLPGVASVAFDVPGKTATVTHTAAADREKLAAALTRAGFPSA